MIKFHAYNNGKAIAVNNHRNLIKAFKYCLIPAILLSVVAVFTEPIALVVIWLLPLLLLMFSRLVFLTEKYDEEVFLQGQKKKHVFTIENGKVLKNGKEMKNIKKVELFRYKDYLLLVFNRDSFYLVPDDAYLVGSRQELMDLHDNYL
ncbi:MAG: hypothetical protein IJ379_02120 [Lachnospiraceae bacterium]|nr:hypothetical protein [Lachnospiraceae bacterium]